MKTRIEPLDRQKAEAIGLAGLAFLAEDGERLGRFLALTGMGPQTLRAEASSPVVLGAVLEHLLADESLLLVFAGMKGLDPASIAPAHALIAGYEAEQ